MDYRITIDEFYQWKDKSLLIDIRDKGSYQYGYVAGAVNVPADTLLKLHEEAGENQEIGRAHV